MTVYIEEDNVYIEANVELGDELGEYIVSDVYATMMLFGKEFDISLSMFDDEKVKDKLILKYLSNKEIGEWNKTS